MEKVQVARELRASRLLCDARDAQRAPYESGLSPADVLVVSPYNAHARAIQKALVPHRQTTHQGVSFSPFVERKKVGSSSLFSKRYTPITTFSLQDALNCAGNTQTKPLTLSQFPHKKRAPGCAQVAAEEPLVQVGTVDKFQGREAPVVIASLCVAAAAAEPSPDDDFGDADHRRSSSLRQLSFVLDARAPRSQTLRA